MSITVEITSGPSVTVTYSAGMNAQQALEGAEQAIGDSSKFLFGLEYYGYSGSQYVGYLVSMINNTYESFPGSTSGPYAYWEFLVNGRSSSNGIDTTILSDGDVVTFTLTQYQPQTARGGATDAAAVSGVLQVKLARRGITARGTDPV